MKTRKFCPHCGRPVLKSYLSKTRNGYKFQCFACDEDFWRFEVYTTRHIKTVRVIRKARYNSKKPYPRTYTTKNQKVNNHGRNKIQFNH